MTVTAEFYKFRIQDIVKQTRPGNHLSEIELPAYPHDKRLCIVSILNDYLSRTKDVRGQTTQLFLSYTKPFKAVSKSTIARWIKTVLHDSGIGTSIFTPHSTRAASISQANKSCVPLHTIMRSELQGGHRTLLSQFTTKNLFTQQVHLHRLYLMKCDLFLP